MVERFAQGARSVLLSSGGAASIPTVPVLPAASTWPYLGGG